MEREERPRRHWRVIAQELATEKDPDRLRALWEEMNRTVRFIRFSEDDNTPPPDTSKIQ